MGTKTDLSRSPYNDDFSANNDYYRLLFRPTTAVQARELTQIQTILQQQIELHGNHIFKDGSIIDGVAITYYPNTHYISCADQFNSNVSSFPTDYDDTYLITNSTDSNNAVRAVIKIAKNGIASAAPDTNRLYLDYISTGTSNVGADVNVFAPGDTLYFYSSDQNKLGTLDGNNLVDSIATLSSNGSFTSNGFAYCIGVSDGIIFQKGFFQRVSPQVITVTDYSTNVAGYVVGFETTESIVTENTDESLYDNSLGYSNENAPGAHRLKLTPTLVSKLRTDSSNNVNFFAIVEFDGSEPTEQNDAPEYNVLEKTLAQKTYEESGDYVVVPFAVETRVHESNTSSFYYQVSPGIAYVRGFRVEKVGSTNVEAPRGLTTEVASNQIVTANYGNYIVVEQMLGAFDFEQISEVTLYDAAQNAITDYEGISSAPSGSSVGTANIRAVQYVSGTKGTPEARYNIYLFNIQMNSGKSFSTDVKSLYADGSFGKIKADVVLENSKAVIKDGTKTSVVLNTGLAGLKRLTNNTGIGDTSYIYNQIQTSTISGAGVTTVTLGTPGPGAATERLNSTAGSLLTGSQIADYYVITTANSYTANLTGTIALQSGNVSIVGTGTAFTSELAANSIIRVYANTSQTYVRRVVNVTNSTFLTIDADIGVTNGTCNFGEYYVTGTPLPLTSVYINSNTSFTANLDVVLDSGSQSVYAMFPVNRNEATAIPKVIRKNRYVKIDCSNNAANTVGPWDLGFVDLHKVRNVYLGTTYANTNPERLEWFTVDDGQRNGMYDHGKLYIKPGYTAQINSSSKMLVELDLFTANTTASVGFFSVESYPIDDANTANTNAIQTIDIPKFNGQSLRDFVDFRPRKYNSANVSATAIGDATINPATSNTSFDVDPAGQFTIAPDSNFTADFEYYLPRIDLITIDPNGTLNVIQGKPSTAPTTPFLENDQSAIARAFVPAYPSPTTRETSANSTFIRIQSQTNRRYTMKDIGALDERIKRIEYYTVLNTLEQQARDLTIPDINGLNRFKNGIFADPFNSHNIGNITDFEYNIAIDKDLNIARPLFERHDVDFAFNSSNSTTVQQTGPVITLPYTSEQYITQRFATKFRNATESVWQWNGLVTLYPAYDVARDETIEPNTTVNIDMASVWEQFANSPFGMNFGDWRTIGSQVIGQSSTQQQLDQWVGNGRRAIDTTSTTTLSTQQQIINQLRVNTQTQAIDLGSYVKDISINPFMRSRIVAFVCFNMKPNTTLHAFFDDVNVDTHCAPGELSGISNPAAGLEDRVVTQTGDFGDALVSDSNGFICGVFRIPAETFRTGDRVFQLTNVDDLTTGADAKITASKATYSADNIAVTKSSTTINVRQPQLSFTQTAQTRTTTETQTTVTEGVWDPISQSFPIENLPDNVTGIYLNEVGVYFKSKDTNLGCTVYVCEMYNNLPNANRIVGSGHLTPAQINVSDDGTTETRFVLDHPVFLLQNNDYAFIVQPDGNSPEYNVWVGETGGFDVATGEQVYSNPYSGIMFVSANRKTWTPIQKEDVKFNLYRAKFTSLTGTAIFNNEADEYITVDGFTRANSSVGIAVGDYVYTVNSSVDTGNTADVVAKTLSSSISGRIQFFDETNGLLWLDSSTANSTTQFSNTTNPTIAIYRPIDSSNTSQINANTLISYGTTTEVKNLKYHTVVPQFGVIQPSRTSLSYQFKGTSNSNIVDTAYTSVINDYDTDLLDYERIALSRSNEINDISGGKSTTFAVSLVSGSDYVSPAINLSRKTMLFIENLINNDSTNEHTRYGSALSKYISKVVELDDGQEAEDVEIRLTAYRPVETDIKLFAKFLNGEDPEEFNQKVWTELEYADDGDLVYSNPSDTTDYIEYKFTVPTTNAVAQAAFANASTSTTTPLSGTMTIANNSYTITGTGTSFDTELVVGDVIRVVSNDYFALRTVTNIANSTSITVDKGLQAANSAALTYVYDDGGNNGIVEYQNSAGSRFVGYKYIALKAVLLSSNPVRVPRLNDYRGICLQI